MAKCDFRYSEVSSRYVARARRSDGCVRSGAGKATVERSFDANGDPVTSTAPVAAVADETWDAHDRIPRILLVDDDPTAILILGGILKGIADIRFATSGLSALEIARDDVPDLVLLDIEMPDVSGLEVCAAMKSDPILRDIPVVFITGHSTADDEIAGLAAGAVDFIAKPPLAPLVVARVRTHLRLKLLTDSLRHSAMADPVTGVGNRRQLESILPKEWLRALREGSPIAMLMIDVDYFKEYNDTYGHRAGDLCLRQVAEAISSITEGSADMLTRYGGDEFALVMPRTDADLAQEVADDLVAGIAEIALPHSSSHISEVVTVSIGVSAFEPVAQRDAATSELLPPPTVTGPDELLLAADRALYAAKQDGRSRAYFRAIAPMSAVSLPMSGHAEQ